MKKFFLLSALFFLIGFFTSVQAQFTDFGARLGMNIGSQSYDMLSNYKSKVFLDIAGVARYQICSEFYAQGELHFVGKGGQDSYEDFGQSIDESLRLSYLEIQIPVFYQIPIESDVVSPNIGFGPYFGYAVGGKYKFGDMEDTDVFDDWHKRGDFGFTLVASVDFTIADLPFFADIRYNFGVVNIIDDDDETVKNKGFGIGVGILFNQQ